MIISHATQNFIRVLAQKDLTLYEDILNHWCDSEEDRHHLDAFLLDDLELCKLYRLVNKEQLYYALSEIAACEFFH